jgi:hypothetical protein
LKAGFPATPAELWDWSTSARGVDAEMAPILKLDFPKGMQHIPQDGQPRQAAGQLQIPAVRAGPPVDLSR